MTMTTRPRQATKFQECTPRHVYDLWKDVARTGGIAPGIAGFCTDCLPDYKRKHMAAGTCNNQNIRFRVDEDGFTEGYVPGKIEEAKCTPSPT